MFRQNYWVESCSKIVKIYVLMICRQLIIQFEVKGDPLIGLHIYEQNKQCVKFGSGMTLWNLL